VKRDEQAVFDRVVEFVTGSEFKTQAAYRAYLDRKHATTIAKAKLLRKRVAELPPIDPVQ
jgi:threonine synthase